MRIACGFLFSILIAANALAQPGLAINKVDRQDLKASVQEVSYSTLLEGTVDDPNLAVYVMVYEPSIDAWRSYRATVADQERDPAGTYKWFAICHFGEIDGRGVGASYQVKAIAIDRRNLAKVKLSDSLSSSAHKSQTLTFKRVKK